MIWHPSDFDLALVNAGDLPAWKRYLVERHLRRCDACSLKDLCRPAQLQKNRNVRRWLDRAVTSSAVPE